jgi:hypothetical protein
MNNTQKFELVETYIKSGIFRSCDAQTQAIVAGTYIDLQRAVNRDRATVLAYLHTPEGRAMVERLASKQQQARPAYGAQSGLITRNGQSIDLARMRADLENDNRRLEALRRQVARERGY